MITRNFKAVLAASIQSSEARYGYLPIQSVAGKMFYLCPYFDRFPYSSTRAWTNTSTAAGISVGRSSDPESDADYNLRDTITSGVNVAITGTLVGADAPGDPYLRYNLTITNTSGSPITIGEVGYKQTVRAASGPGRNEYQDVVILLDRTVLDVPITLAAGDAGVVAYKIKTVMNRQTKGGVEIVPWALGSDAQIAEMIDAAQLGLIDLHEDGGWNISDRRKVRISAFTDDNGTSYPAQDIELIISSFSEYNGCGNVLQFDFMQCLSVLKRMNPSNNTAGGYGEMELFKNTIPALVNAMPAWIRNRLKTFKVYAWDTASASLTEVEDNKLALRARVEIFGPSNLASDVEGSRIPLYAMDTEVRQKRQGYSGTSSVYAWTRTPYNVAYMYTVYYNNGSQYNTILNQTGGIAPFGCM